MLTIEAQNIIGISEEAAYKFGKLIDTYNSHWAKNAEKDVYYEGSESDFKAIDFKSDNSGILNAEIHYNSVN